MNWDVGVAALVVLAVALAALIAARQAHHSLGADGRRGRHHGGSDRPNVAAVEPQADVAGIAAWARDQAAPELLLSDLLSEADGSELQLQEGDAVVQMLDGEHVIVFASQPPSSQLGDIVGRAAQPVVQAAGRASAVTTAALDVAEQTGYLVKLAPGSRDALRTQEKIHAAGGYMLGVLRDGETKKFSHVLKVKPARLAQTAASGAAILSALAGQAQLDRIEKQLGAIAADAKDLRADYRDRHSAELIGAQRLLGEVYAAARACGTLTPSMWSQIAPMAHTVYMLQEESLLRIRRVVKKLDDLASIKVSDRVGYLDRLQTEIDELVKSAWSEERAVVQFQLLRIWRLAQERDPALQHVVKSVSEGAAQRRDAMLDLYTQIIQATENPDAARRLRDLPRRWKRKQLRTSAQSLRQVVDERLRTGFAVPLTESPRPAEASPVHLPPPAGTSV